MKIGRSTFLLVGCLLGAASVSAQAEPPKTSPAPVPRLSPAAPAIAPAPAPSGKVPVATPVPVVKTAVAPAPAPTAPLAPAQPRAPGAPVAPVAPAVAKASASVPAAVSKAPTQVTAPAAGVSASPQSVPVVGPAHVGAAPVPKPQTASVAKPAGDAVPPSAAAPAPGTQPAPVAAAPKPAPELDQMKVLEGSWRCAGRAPAGPAGPEHAYKSTWKFKRDLDNFWWAAEYQQAKAKAHPIALKARGYMTWDAAAKAFVLVGIDNMGGSSTESTTGWSGDVVMLAGDANLAGKKVPYREVITKKGSREFTWRGEMKTGGDWVTLGEDRCKK